MGDVVGFIVYEGVGVGGIGVGLDEGRGEGFAEIEGAMVGIKVGCLVG